MGKEVYQKVLLAYLYANYKLREIVFFIENKEIDVVKVDLRKFLRLSKNKRSNYKINECLKYLTDCHVS